MAMRVGFKTGEKQFQAKTLASKPRNGLLLDLEGCQGGSSIRLNRHRWLAAIVESSDNAIIGIDLKGRIISCNKSVSRLYGYAPDELIGKPANIFTADEFKEAKSHAISKALGGETIELYETVHCHRDGTRFDVSLTISPVRDTDGTIIGASKIIRDVTPRKRVEKQLAEILSREQSANRAKDQFLAALSHELRTPLNPVLLLASELANDPTLQPSVRQNIETIRKNVELEARLIDDLLDLTRITRGKLALNQSELEAHSILKDAISTVFPEINQKQVLLKLNLRAARHKIVGDPVRLQQIFWNVVKNAVKFTPEGGQISVESDVLPDDKLSISVTDTGIGMNADELVRIFDAFSQGNHHFGGLGLGLAISRALVELHRGSIKASSAGKGKGATFTIELPLLAPKGTSQPQSPGRTPRPQLGPICAKGIHILLVEDHEPTRSALKQLLSRRHFRVASAGSCSEARSLMKKYDDFKLIISDIGLPDGRGFDLMTEFHRKFGAKGIALTGYGREEEVAQSQAAGFTTHLTKPVSVESLENALAVVLRIEANKVFIKNGMPR